jgi:5,10-methylene-tetrahydrofolate dehydrogenase/methenyl tetrahydrofolate cyclohydrolase
MLNDINSNNTKEALRYLIEFLNVNKKVNIVLITLPLRYDLLQTSCVNKEIMKFNRQLKKIVKVHTNVVLLDVDLQRMHYTRHGQYLNQSGKDLVSFELARIIANC